VCLFQFCNHKKRIFKVKKKSVFEPFRNDRKKEKKVEQSENLLAPAASIGSAFRSQGDRMLW
jgi:hypothetical protein